MSAKNQIVFEFNICSTPNVSSGKRVENSTFFKNVAASRCDQQACANTVDGTFSFASKSFTNLIFVWTENFEPKTGQKSCNKIPKQRAIKMNFILLVSSFDEIFNFKSGEPNWWLMTNISNPLYSDWFDYKFWMPISRCHCFDCLVCNFHV